MIRSILSVAAALGFAACAWPAQAPAPGSRSVALAVGERARVGDLTVRFTGVQNDSRCAPGHQCIREGEAEIDLEVWTDAAPARLRLETSPPDSAVADYRGYRVRVDSLSWTRDPYRAWFTVAAR